MDPVILGLGGVAMTSLLTMGRMMYNYGRDRKELNGTVDRVKNIEKKLDEHMADENMQVGSLRGDMREIKTKVDLLIDHKIKDTHG